MFSFGLRLPWALTTTAGSNRLRIWDGYVVVGQNELGHLNNGQALRLKHHYDKTTGIHRLAVLHQRQLVGHLPLPDAQKLAEHCLNKRKLYARVLWKQEQALPWEKLYIRISADFEN